MLDLGYVLELVDDCLGDGPFSQQKDIPEWCHRLGFHVAPELCNQMDATKEEGVEHLLVDNIAIVTKKLHIDLFHELLALEHLIVMDISRCDLEISYLSTVVVRQVQFEAVEPSFI